MTILGTTLAYTAEAGRVPIRDVASGEPVGYMFYLAYRVPQVSGKRRALSFIWNGGPGTPSAVLNFEGAGPKRLQNGQMVDNADTWLTDSDLVFVDPVGVGFSRAVSEAAQSDFTSNIGDVASVTEFVRSWVLLHGDEDAPLVIAGESYGAGRAGSVAYRLLKRGMNVRALALISNTTGLPRYPGEETIAPAMHVGDYAVAAQYFKRLPPELGTTPAAARASAEKWAREVYIPALRRLEKLTADEKAKVIGELARHIGLSPADINPKTLSITEGYFLGHIAHGYLPYYSDYRIRMPFKAPPLGAAIRYVRHELGYPTDLPYLGVESLQDGFAPSGTYPRTVNELWLHSTVYGATRKQVAEAEAQWEKKGLIGMGKFGPDLPGAADAIKLNPRLKILVAHGAYDPLGGCSMDAELSRHLLSPFREDITFRCYLSGHVIVRDAQARAQFAADMRALARAALAEQEVAR